MKRTVYLAGPISMCTYNGATEWRAEVAEKLDSSIAPLSPMRHKEYLLHETTISDQYNETIMSSQKAITTRDRFDTTNADMVLINLLDAERVSIGTMIEIGWADANRIPIVIAMQEGNLHDHSMVRECAGWIVPTLDEAIMVVNKTLVPGV